MKTNALFDSIRQWGRDRGLDRTNSVQQHDKLEEEVAELWDALLSQNKTDIIDAIGDCVVVLTMIAMQERLKIEDCIASAYDEIKNRKGKLVNGVFVKDTIVRPDGCDTIECQRDITCGARDANSVMECTLPPGHAGDHIACGLHVHNLRRWPNISNEPPAQHNPV